MFDFISSDPETTWLTVTNIILGAVTLVCCGVVALGIAHEVLSRQRRAREAHAGDALLFDDHALSHAKLGLTMADGGEKLDKTVIGKANRN